MSIKQVYKNNRIELAGKWVYKITAVTVQGYQEAKPLKGEAYRPHSDTHNL